MAEDRTGVRPMVLAILDGWGVRAETSNNAIHHANTPNFDKWLATRPHAQVRASEGDVGLPDGQMGNSEVGHINLGAGRIVYQDYARINRDIVSGAFADNAAMGQALKTAINNGSTLHLMGLLSPGGVHSHSEHIVQAVQMAADAGVKDIQVHAFLDGRDTPPRSALEYISGFENALASIGSGRIASVCGRYYAMDRDTRWDRVERAYAMLVMGEGLRAKSATAAVEDAYARDENDEFVQPTVIIQDATMSQSQGAACMDDGDVVMMLNFRADRAREITHALIDPQEGEGRFEGFERPRQVKLGAYLCMTQYEEGLADVLVAYPPNRPTGVLGEHLAKLGLKQLRAAETEKYAHVTYFFNGGEEEPFEGEDRLLIPSPDVATYDLKPEMSAHELTDALVQKVASGQYDFIAVNYANPDMVGHTGVFDAAVKAIETVDHCLGRLAEAVFDAGGEMLVTADHGNADLMVKEETGQPHTAHTLNPAPLLYLGRKAHIENGALCDVAPTLLALMGLETSPQMEGRALIQLADHEAA